MKRNNAHTNSGTKVSLDELIKIRERLNHDSIISKKKGLQLLSGQNMTRVYGRGIEFDSTREYQPGDDIRRMAWRLTARSLKPHIKVYQVEKERPIWLALDLSPSLYFGTKRMFKSVRVIQEAAFLGWAYLKSSERIGACIATTHQSEYFTPRAREKDYLQILKSLAHYSEQFPNYDEKNCLETLLVTLQKQIRAGQVIFILSDFFNLNEQHKKIMMQLAKYCQVNLIFVYDPLEATPPPPYRYKVTNGTKSLCFNMENEAGRLQYQEQFKSKYQQLTNFARKYGIALDCLCTND